MSLFSSPSPQWFDFKTTAAIHAYRLVPVLDATGFWTLIEGATPSGAYKVDGTSGFTVIDNAITIGLKPTLLPSGNVVIY